MKSTLFTDLTVSEESNLSGGFFFPKNNKSFNKQEAKGGEVKTGNNTIKGDKNSLNNSADAINTIS